MLPKPTLDIHLAQLDQLATPASWNTPALCFLRVIARLLGSFTAPSTPSRSPFQASSRPPTPCLTLRCGWEPLEPQASLHCLVPFLSDHVIDRPHVETPLRCCARAQYVHGCLPVPTWLDLPFLPHDQLGNIIGCPVSSLTPCHDLSRILPLSVCISDSHLLLSIYPDL